MTIWIIILSILSFPQDISRGQQNNDARADEYVLSDSDNDIDNDSDNDGINDTLDAFPEDPAAANDSDSDGYPDSWNHGMSQENSTQGLELDAFPFDKNETTDSDRDGVGNNSDAFPNDPAASVDSDGDEYPDNWNQDMNQDNSTSRPKLILDKFPMDGNEHSDTDNDGLGDEEDKDDDNDRMPDSWELNHSLNPKDDADSILDADFDGVSNLNEFLANTNPLDPDERPDLINNNPDTSESQNPSGLLALIVLIVLFVMIFIIIIGMLIIERRKRDEEFYELTFGRGSGGKRKGGKVGKQYQGSPILRKKYLDWRSELGNDEIRKIDQKYPLEIIGGPKDTKLGESTHKPSYRNDPRFKGRFCIWCDKAIASKYLKRCTSMRSKTKRCRDGPFCSTKCLNEHLHTVPHFKEVEF